jgi:hypothetical protein
MKSRMAVMAKSEGISRTGARKKDPEGSPNRHRVKSGHEGLGNKNHYADEDRQPGAGSYLSTLYTSERALGRWHDPVKIGETEKYGHESRCARNQE